VGHGGPRISAETAEISSKSIPSLSPPEERREHRAVGKESSSCGGDDLDTSVVHGGRDDAVGSYFTEWYNALMLIAGRPVDIDGPVSVRSAGGRGDNGVVYANLRHPSTPRPSTPRPSARPGRGRCRFRFDGKTSWRLSANAAVASTATEACGRPSVWSDMGIRFFHQLDSYSNSFLFN